MKRRETRGKHVKRHVISLRISTEEWDSLHDVMAGLQFKRVSDLMREAFKRVHEIPVAFDGAVTEGQQRIAPREHRLH